MLYLTLSYLANLSCKMPLEILYFSSDMCYYSRREDELQNEEEAYQIRYVCSSAKTHPLKRNQKQFKQKRTN